MEPAGEMWSVVTESPSRARTRAPAMGATASRSAPKPTKNGGKATYVDEPSQRYRSPTGISSAFHSGPPSKTEAYAARNSSPLTADPTVARTSSVDGQTSTEEVRATV